MLRSMICQQMKSSATDFTDFTDSQLKRAQGPTLRGLGWSHPVSFREISEIRGGF
jgi:hypothetical protein